MLTEQASFGDDEQVPDPVWAGRAFRLLVLSRAIEDKLHTLFKQGRLHGRLVSGRGQEAIPVGATLALQDADLVAPVHRDLGAHLARGTTATTVFRHYLGCVTGPSRGRDGDIHMGEWNRGVFPMVSHLPDSWPVMVGAALGFQLRGEKRAALAFCGDGATSTGTFHESVNFAAVFQLPIVFVVENNQFAYSTPARRQYRLERLVDRALGYGIAGVRVDGNDVVAVHRAALAALDSARQGGGPTLIEAETMRMDGHAVHDSGHYVPHDLLEQWGARDPLALFEQSLRNLGWTDRELAACRTGVKAEVDEAWLVAEGERTPNPSELEEGVYCQVWDDTWSGDCRCWIRD